MFERICTGFSLARCSGEVLWKDKKLIVFPILSGVACLLVMATFVTPFVIWRDLLDKAVAQDANGDTKVQVWVWAVLFAYYFCNYFVVIFFNAALISCALVRFNGGEPTLADGLGAAASRLPQILAWALVSATVGVILKMIENANEKIGAFLSAILGTAWSVVTYFVVPVLVVERVGPFEAVRRSLSILRRTWGEALVGNMGMGLFVFLLFIPVIVFAVIGGVLLSVMPPVGIGMLVLAAIGFGLCLAIGPALHGIFLAALYQYAANGEVPNGFDGDDLRRAFARKR